MGHVIYTVTDLPDEAVELEHLPSARAAAVTTALAGLSWAAVWAGLSACGAPWPFYVLVSVVAAGWVPALAWLTVRRWRADALDVRIPAGVPRGDDDGFAERFLAAYRSSRPTGDT